MLSFIPNLEYCAEQLLAADPSFCWLYLNKQAVDHFVLFCIALHLELGRATFGSGYLLLVDRLLLFLR